MAVKKVTYKEPKNYFNAAMKKADRDYDKQQAAAKKQTTSKTDQKKK